MSAIDVAPAPAKHLYCPILFKFAARLEQMAWSDFISGPVDTVAALRNAQTACGADLIVNWFDTWAECEALGAAVVRDAGGDVISYRPPPRVSQPLALLKSELLPRLKDVAVRLHAERRRGTLLGGFLTGPWTLARRLAGALESESMQFAVQWAIESIRSYGEIGLDLSIIAEEEPGAAALYRGEAKTLQPLVNLSRYYRHPLIVLNRGAAGDEAAEVTIGGAPPIGTINLIPEALFTSPAEITAGQWELMLRRAAAGRILMLSSWEVPAGAEPERLRELGARLKSGGA